MISPATAEPPALVTAYIALGSNLQQPRQQVESAINALDNMEQSKLLATSSWYRSRAVGPGQQPDYINGVARIQTALSPLALLEALQQIEQAHGRERQVRWGARTLDLDILLYGTARVHSERLNIPHPRLGERNFVLYPLAELAPRLELPNGSKVADLAQRLGWDGLSKIE